MAISPSGKVPETVIAQEREAGGVTVLELNGRLTVGEGSEILDARLQQLLQAGRIRLVLDFSKATTIDSQGISALVRSVISSRKRGGNVKLVNPGRRVKEVLTITRLLDVIESYDSEEAALRSFS